MTATTEPPWLHSTAGVAARNGTSSHTITWSTDGGSPFTAGLGSLMVVMIFGAVTHTVSGSWSEVAQPVNSGELSLFVSTNNSSTAPPTSITVTHNASNYPIEYFVGELPAGSSYVSSSGTSPNNDTFAALTGLTGGAGNERLILAAIGRTATSVAYNSFSTVWTSPFVKDTDQFAPFSSSTDGGGMSVAHQINNTSTSATPVVTPTYGPSGWSTPDREMIVAAFIAVPPSGGTTSVSSTLSAPWTVRQRVTSTLSAPWALRASVKQQLSTPWALRNVVKQTLSTPWTVRQAISAQLSAPWTVRAAVKQQLSAPWVVRQSIKSLLDARWGVAGKVSGTLDARWALRQAVQATLSTPWALRASVSAPLDVRWAQRALVAATLDARWGVAGKVTSVLNAPWAIRGVVSGTLDARWALRSQISVILVTPWTVRRKVTSNLQVLWVVEGAPLTDELKPSVGAAGLTAHLTAYPEPGITAYL